MDENEYRRLFSLFELLKIPENLTGNLDLHISTRKFGVQTLGNKYDVTIYPWNESDPPGAPGSTLFPQPTRQNINIFMEVYHHITGAPIRQTVHLHVQTRPLSLSV